MRAQTKKGVCTNPQCPKYHNEFTAFAHHYVCPVCKQPLSDTKEVAKKQRKATPVPEKPTQEPKKNPPGNNNTTVTQPKVKEKKANNLSDTKMSVTGDKFPWTAALIMVALGLIALGGSYYYATYWSAKEENKEEEELYDGPKESPEATKLQEEFSRLIAASEGQREDLVKLYKQKYQSNVSVVYQDTSLNKDPAKMPLSDYIEYLDYFSQPGRGVQISAITVDTIENVGGSTIVHVIEQTVGSGGQ